MDAVPIRAYFAPVFADTRGTSPSRMSVLLQKEKVSNAEKAALCCKRCLKEV